MLTGFSRLHDGAHSFAGERTTLASRPRPAAQLTACERRAPSRSIGPVLAALALAVAGCHRHDLVPRIDPDRLQAAAVPPASPPRIEPRWFRMSLATARGEVPFFLGLVGPVGAEHAIIANGDERIAADVVRTGAHLRITFPIFGTWLDLEVLPDGSLAGLRVVPFRSRPDRPVTGRALAELDPLARFPAPAAGAGSRFDFSGTWRVNFDELGTGKGVVTQDPHGLVEATFILKAFGDLRFLEGRVDGNQLLLSTFDGQHAYAFRVTGGPDPDRLAGEWDDADEFFGGSFTGVRDGAVATALYDGSREVPAKGGLSLPELDQPPYLGKAVIVDLFGTWCPGCMDETPFLVELYREHHAEGLEMLSLAYEVRSHDENRGFVDRFIAHYGVTWRVIVIDASFDDLDPSLPAELHGTETWPTAVFLDRHHQIRAIRSGFIGPAAGADHAALTAAWQAEVRALLAP